ncbi:protein of unknown function [Stenotrophomonas maltophilia]|nr:protein of unknown function [Stenotrophomonas maltophilia]
MKAVEGLWGMAVFIADPWQADGHALPGRAHPRRSRRARTGVAGPSGHDAHDASGIQGTARPSASPHWRYP